MRILTWNIHGTSIGDRKERFPIIRDAIERYQPDIACIQEVLFPKSRSMLDGLTDYHVSRELNFFPPLTTKGGLATLTRSKPLEVSFHPYQSQGNFFTEQKWDKLIGKGFLETIIEDTQLGKVRVINTHNVCTYTEDTDRYLEAQAEQLLQRIKSHTENGEFIIVAGDFNFKRKSKLYPQFRALLHDATEGLGDFHLLEYETIDYILLGDKYNCKSTYVYQDLYKKYPSDHPGIFVEVELNR